MTVRKPVTLTAQVAAFMEYALCPRCFKPFAGDVEFDHDPPLGAGGKDHDEKPMTPLHADCHARKTKRDRKIIAKTNRMAGLTGQQARRKRNGSKLKSRGFDKGLSKKFSGEVVRKEIE